MIRRSLAIIAFIVSFLLIWFFLSLQVRHVYAHMADRPDLDRWFSGLASKRGLCCSFADGISIKDVDWDIDDDGHYRVRIPATGKFPGSKDYLRVPDDAVITEPNRYGSAVVWPYFDGSGAILIRCFMPGALT